MHLTSIRGRNDLVENKKDKQKGFTIEHPGAQPLCKNKIIIYMRENLKNLQQKGHLQK